jgi:hypothetical protein
MKDFDVRHVPLRLPKAKQLLSHINKTFGKNTYKSVAYSRCMCYEPSAILNRLYMQYHKLHEASNSCSYVTSCCVHTDSAVYFLNLNLLCLFVFAL